MRSGTEIHKISLTVEGYPRTLWKIIYKLNLIWLILLLHKFQRFLSCKLKALKGYLLFHYFFHLSLYPVEIFLRERRLYIEIIIKPSIYRRTNCKLCLRIETLYRLCKNV